ncbi:MAG: NHLP bacteriocin system secretion protein [Planctomycetota bacterium]
MSPSTVVRSVPGGSAAAPASEPTAFADPVGHGARGVRPLFRPAALANEVRRRPGPPLCLVRPHSWLLLGAFAMGLAVLVGWAVWGSIPSTARGAAIVVRPTHVVSFQAPASGRIESVAVAVGDPVARGALIAKLAFPHLAVELEHEHDRLALARAHDAELRQREDRLIGEQLACIRDQRSALAERIERMRAASADYSLAHERYLDEQRSNLRTAAGLAARLQAAASERFVAARELFEHGADSKAALVEPQARLLETELRNAELVVRGAELDLLRLSAVRYVNERHDAVRDMETELAELQVAELTIQRQRLERQLDRRRDLAEIEQRIARLEVRQRTTTEIRSEFSGRVLEVAAAVGQRVEGGERIGRIETGASTAALKALAYFSIKDGKRVRAGQRIRLSPSTVARERFGSMVGRVERVSDFPVTTAAAAHQIGGIEAARALLGGEPRIQVEVALERDPRTPTSFEWTSGRGPDGLEITSGTTADAWVTLEERAPIALVLPFLRSVVGG